MGWCRCVSILEVGSLSNYKSEQSRYVQKYLLSSFDDQSLHPTKKTKKYIWLMMLIGCKNETN